MTRYQWAGALAPLAVLALVAGDATAQALDARTRAAIDSVFRDTDRSDTPGCAVLVRRDGRTVFARGYGMASLELGVALTPQTVLDIGSTSKQVTAATVLLLAQEGRLDLDAPIQRYLPEVPVLEAPVTLRHLLTHTSGWRDYLGLLRLDGVSMGEPATGADALAVLARQRGGLFRPGTAFRYSNTGFFLAGQAVERVTGRQLREVVTERFFVPLGMTHSTLFDDHARVVPGRALAYAPSDSGWTLALSNWEQTGDGAVLTSVEDLARWDEQLDHGVVGGAALRDAQLATARLEDGTSVQYAFGLFVDRYRGARRVHHGGAWAGYRAMSMRFPEQRVAIYLACNRADARPDRRAESVADAVLGDVLGPRASVTWRDSVRAPTAAEVRPLEGTWLSAQGDILRIAADDSGGIARTLSGRPMGRLLTVGGGTFLLEPEEEQPDRFGLSAAGDALEWSNPVGVRQRFTRLAPAPTLTPAQRRAYSGAYAGEEADESWQVRATGDSLLIAFGSGEPVPMRVVAPDLFEAARRGVRFTRDARGRVTGAELLDWDLGFMRWRKTR